MSVPILSEGAFSMREEDLCSWFDNKEFHKMTVEFISFFEHFRDKTYLGLTEREKSELNRSVLYFSSICLMKTLCLEARKILFHLSS